MEYTPFLLILLDPLWPGMEVLVMTLSMDQVDLFQNYSYLMKLLETYIKSAEAAEYTNCFFAER